MSARFVLAGLLLGLAYLVGAGCGNQPSVPDLDEIRDIPRSDQLTLIPPSSVDPPQGFAGTVITVHGRGLVFPRGVVAVSFTGAARFEFDLEEPTQQLRIRIPQDARSGPFGFTISGRSRFLENPRPTSEVFVAYRVDFPGIRILPDPVVPPNGVPQPPNQGPPANG